MEKSVLVTILVLVGSCGMTPCLLIICNHCPKSHIHVCHRKSLFWRHWLSFASIKYWWWWWWWWWIWHPWGGGTKFQWSKKLETDFFASIFPSLNMHLWTHFNKNWRVAKSSFFCELPPSRAYIPWIHMWTTKVYYDQVQWFFLGRTITWSL